MKAAKTIILFLIVILSFSCRPKEGINGTDGKASLSALSALSALPLDKGFSEYITGYTSGVIQSNSVIEIRFTTSFAATADKKALSGLFAFEPAIKGKAEWTDDVTLVFRPSKPLESGKLFTGGLNLYKISNVKERLKVFPLRIQTLKKDFNISFGNLVCSTEGEESYDLQGVISASDFIEPQEVESFIKADLGRKNQDITWDHSENLTHRFTITNITRSDREQELEISWNGSKSGISQKGSSTLTVPAKGTFSVLGIKTERGENQQFDIVFSDPVDPDQEIEGLAFIEPAMGTTFSINSNIVTIIPSDRIQGIVAINVEQSVRSINGLTLESGYSEDIDFTVTNPEIELTGNGVIVPTSENLIFPFKAVNLKSVDLKIIKVFENNLPYFLQENEISSGYSFKQFARPVYSGKVDLDNGTGAGAGTWNLYTIDLADYIDVEPGVLYKVQLGMRKSYSLYPCATGAEKGKFEELLEQSQEISSEYWDDPDNYYEDSEDALFYSFGFDWDDYEDPCKEAYYNPNRTASRNILASNLGLIAKKGEDNMLHIFVNDLNTALPVKETEIEVYDYQLQIIESGTTNQDGSLTLFCERKPFLIIAEKDGDRNYLKTNDGSSLSLSSFDVSGSKPVNGIKAFIYGERDVWRPGDSIFLSLLIKDMINDLPPDHPVQFELINPLEQRVDFQVRNTSGMNLLSFASKTSSEAVTGNYRAQFRIGGATFTKRIRIETIKPNRLKISLKFPKDILGGSDKQDNGTLNVKWMNGSVARNLNTSVEYLLKQTPTVFPRYSQYTFDDPANDFYSESVTAYTGIIDENGNATVKFSPGDELNAPGMLNAQFTVKVSEQGGDESIIQANYKYAAYPVFVGINFPGLQGKSRMLFTDTDNEVKIVTVDEQGKAVKSEVEIAVYKLSYRWWWESDDENLAYYISRKIYKPVIQKTVNTSLAGEATFSFNIGKEDWGRYLVRATTPAGHSTGRMLLVDWPWEYGMKASSDGATLLTINTDKEKYSPGENVKLSFPSPENARAIITIENSTGVINELRVSTTKSNTEVSLPVTPEMAPNVYAYVTVIQPHSQTINDMPVRLYGIVPVIVEDPGTRLSPKIDMPDEIRSQRSFEINVSEANQQVMSYTIAVVDEGLLDITGFKTPDPWSYFYSREALGVQTWDLYDYVLGAFGGTLDRIFAVGGDGVVIDRSANKAQRFVPVVRFLGPFTLEARKTNTHKITLPQYTGSVKTMVIAANNRAFGTAEKSSFVKDPLMILVTAPRVISPGEKAALPVTLFIQKDGISEVTIKAESNELVRFENSTITIPVKEQGEKDSEFLFTASEKTGVATIKVTATGGGETAVYNLEMQVRSPNPPETRSDLKVLKPGETWETMFTPFGIEGSNLSVLEISGLQSANLEKRMNYLTGYPHGCSEQIISTAFPQLWLKELSNNDKKTAEESGANIKEAINKLISRQMANGGIALWPGSAQPDNWVTSYAGHFMYEAERMGYNIPVSFKQKWISYQQKTAQSWRFDAKFTYTANDQAYRLLSLALAGQPEKGAMNRLRETTTIPQLAKWLLAAGFATTGRPEVAQELLDMRNTETGPEFYNYYYGSQLRDKAIILYTLTLLKNEEAALPLFNEICKSLSTDNWYSTQSLSWGLFSYMKFVALLPAGNNSSIRTTITFNGESSDNTTGGKTILSKQLTAKAGNNTLTVKNNSENTVYATLIRQGTPLVSDNLKEENGLSMKVDYLDMELKPVNINMLTQGTDFMAVVKVTNNTFSLVENIALTQMTASGWEIQNTRLYEANRGIKEGSYDYRDIKDDRVNTYFSLNQGETKTFVLILNAAYRGEFILPSLWCEAMYSDNCYSRIPGEKVKITGE